MDISNFLGIAIVGAGLSVFVEWAKHKYGINSFTTKALTVGLAVGVGALYWFAQDTVIWTTILGVLASASTVYAFLFNGKR